MGLVAEIGFAFLSTYLHRTCAQMFTTNIIYPVRAVKASSQPESNGLKPKKSCCSRHNLSVLAAFLATIWPGHNGMDSRFCFASL